MATSELNSKTSRFTMAPNVRPLIDRIQVDDEVSLRRDMFSMEDCPSIEDCPSEDELELEPPNEFQRSPAEQTHSFGRLSVRDHEDSSFLQYKEKIDKPQVSHTFIPQNENYGGPGGEATNLPEGGRSEDLLPGGGVPTRQGGRSLTGVATLTAKRMAGDYNNIDSSFANRQVYKHRNERRGMGQTPTLKLGSYDGSTCLLTFPAKFEKLL